MERARSLHATKLTPSETRAAVESIFNLSSLSPAESDADQGEGLVLERFQVEKLKRNVIRTLDIIDHLSFELAEQVQEASAGHRFGRAKYLHMNDMLYDASTVARNENLSLREALLYAVVVKAHDIGRHKEALLKLDTLRPGKRHGWLSAEILQEAGALQGFHEVDQEIILAAVIFHAEKDFPADADALSRKLCYLLRDHDKEEALCSPNYFTTQGIAEQITLHYCPEMKVSAVEREVKKILKDQKNTLATTNGSLSEVSRIIDSGVSDELFSVFIKMQSIDVQRIRESWAAYMLFQLALLFDIESVVVLNRICRSRFFPRRLQFLKDRLTPQQYSQTVEILNLLLSRKGILRSF